MMNDLRIWLLERYVEREALALAATPGPWLHTPEFAWMLEGDPHQHEVVTDISGRLGVSLAGPYGDPQSRADARYIASQSPDREIARVRAMISLLSPIRRIEWAAVRVLAEEFRGEPGWRDEWASPRVGAGV